MKTIPVATRIDPTILAIIRDRLIEVGYPAKNLSNNAQIIKAITLFGFAQLQRLTNFNSIPTQESLSVIEQNKKKLKVNVGSK